MIEHLGDLCQVALQPVPFAIQWDTVRKVIVEGLVLTGYSRYVDWFGSARYMKRCREEDEEEADPTFRGPSAFKRQRCT
jgi:hypothetical protein